MDAAKAAVIQYSEQIKRHRRQINQLVVDARTVPWPPDVILDMEAKGGLDIPVLLARARFAEMRSEQ